MDNNKTQISVGKTTDSSEKLEMLCKNEAEKLLQTLDFDKNERISLSFWTSDFPELICEGVFFKEDNGSIKYQLDFSQSTL